TPGHTPESTCLTVTEPGQETAQAVLTGDTLFIGDVGRPDLMSSVGCTAQDLAQQLYDSLHQKLMTLPDETLVYPGHGAGSMCGKNLSTDTVSTIGAQRETNYALQPMTRDEFVAQVTADQPKVPEYFPHDAMLNRKQRQVMDTVVQRGMQSLSKQQFLDAIEGGAQVLDAREEPEYADGHIVRSINIGLSGKFATWAGTLLDLDLPIVVVAGRGREQEVAIRLGRIGLDNMLGFLRGGIASMGEDPEWIAKTKRATVTEAAAQLAATPPPFVLDVRGPGEFAEGHIEGSVNIPLIELRARAFEVPSDRPVLVICRSGFRSSAGLSVLEAYDRTQSTNVVGGMLAWHEMHTANP
ncbi:MAG: rhodanese-like domain-containing protein, partial [Myxococcota bacterium]